MRRKPVTRSEIRFNGSFIATLPVDAVREEDRGYIAPIHKLFAPLLRSLNRASKRDYDERAQAFEAIGLAQRGAWEPISLPDRYIYRMPRLCACQRCGREFYRVTTSGHYCSDDCAEASQGEQRASRNAEMVRTRSKERAAARAGRRCANPDCNKRLKAQRSSMKFCSIRCRVAVHRARSKDST